MVAICFCLLALLRLLEPTVVNRTLTRFAFTVPYTDGPMMEFLFLQTNGQENKLAGHLTRQLEAHRTSHYIRPQLDIHTDKLQSPEQEFKQTKMLISRTFRILHTKPLLPSKDLITTLPLLAQQMLLACTLKSPLRPNHRTIFRTCQTTALQACLTWMDLTISVSLMEWMPSNTQDTQCPLEPPARALSLLLPCPVAIA